MPKQRSGIKASAPAAAAAAAGGSRRQQAVAAKKQRAKKAAGSSGGGGASAAQLIERAQQALGYDDYDLALQCLSEAAAREPGNVEALDAYGSLLAETGRADDAVMVLRRAVELSPDAGFEKYMYLGQLLEGEEGLAATRRGVEVLSAQADAAVAAAAPGSGKRKGGGGAGGEAGELKQQLCSALCSLAEMTMAAAGNLEEAAEEVASLLQRARSADASSPEPLQALASLRYEQGRQDEALALLRESMALWFKPERSEDDEDEDEDEDEEGGEGSERDGDGDEELGDVAAAAAAGTGKGGRRRRGSEGAAAAVVKPRTMSEDLGEEDMGGGDDDDDMGGSGDWVDADAEDDLPSFEFRFECAKLLLELDESTDAAVQVLEEMIAENDSVPDVWHMLGLAYYSGGLLDEAQEAADHGAGLLAKQRGGAHKGGRGSGKKGRAEEGEEACDDVAAAFEDLKAAIAEARGALEGGEGGGGA